MIKEVNKKLFVIFIISLLLISFLALTLALAQEIPESPITPEEAENIKTTTETKWDYLARHWQIMLLSNPVVKAIDTVFTKLDSIGFFIVLFAVHWQLSFTVIFSIILWVFFFFFIKRQLKKLTSLKKEYCYLISLAAVLFLAWIKLFINISEDIWNDFTTAKGRILLTVLFLIILWTLLFIDKSTNQVKKARLAGKATEAEAKVERISKFEESFEEGAGI